jgi:DNA helicase HerA-like ATPase
MSATVVQNSPLPALDAAAAALAPSAIVGLRIDAAVDLTVAAGFNELDVRDRLELAAKQQHDLLRGLLDPAAQTAYDLRLRAGMGHGLEMAVLVRSWDASAEAAEARAAEMRSAFRVALPDQVIASEVDELGDWLAPFDGAAPLTDAYYVCRSEMTEEPNRPDAGVPYYFAVAQWNWAATDWRGLYQRLERAERPVMVSIGLLPLPTPPALSDVLGKYASLYGRLSHEAQQTGLSMQRQHAPEAFAVNNEPVFRDYQRRLRHRAFAIRILVAGHRLGGGLAEAVAAAISPPDPESGSGLDRQRAGGGSELRSSLDHAEANLRDVGFVVPPGDPAIWGRRPAPSPLLAPLAVLGDPRDATCAFRLPIAATGDLGGFPVRRPSRIGHQEQTRLAAGTRALTIGDFPDGAGALRVSVDSLTKHALVAGSTGSGKTTAVLELLKQLWLDHRVPFLVIEPVNSDADDYRKLRAEAGFEDIDIVTVADERLRPLRFNPMRCPDRVLVGEHLANLLNCFKAAFGLWEPLPAIYVDALTRMYLDAGILPSERAGDVVHEWPTVADFRRAMQAVCAQLDYQGEIRSNIEAASLIRAQSLVVGPCASAFLTDRALDCEALLARPTVIELKVLGNGDEQALMIALLLNAITEHYQANRGASPRLEHVTVVEEAHRLLARPKGSSGSEEAAAKEQAAESFANVLAENRKYGEGIVISEQIPTKLVEDAVKNTNLKIMCRLTSEEEREYLGETMALSERESDMAARLRTGQAIVYSDELERAVELRLPRTILGEPVPAAAGGARPAFALCERCPRPCEMRGPALAIPQTPGFADLLREAMRGVLETGGDERAASELELVGLLDRTLDRYPGAGVDGDAELRAAARLCVLLHTSIHYDGALHPGWVTVLERAGSSA